MSRITKIVLFFLALAFGLVLIVAKKDAIASIFRAPCAQPIEYTVVTPDAQFHLTQSDAQNDVQEAADIWNKSYSHPLFTATSPAKLTIHFIFDERQALTDQLNSLDRSLTSRQQTYNQQLAQFQALAQQFHDQLSKYNQEVNYWNSHGGAADDVYRQLNLEQASLQDQQTKLKALATQLNLSADAYNTQVNDFNQTAQSYANSRNTKPEEGVYIASKDEIDIYHYDNQAELIHTIAHELGHALGLEHVADPHAIMYAQTSANLTPTTEDISALQTACQATSIISRLRSAI